MDRDDRDRFVGFAFAAAHALIETDANGRITFATGARCRLVPHSIDELVGANLYDLVAPRDQGMVVEIFRRLAEVVKIEPMRLVFRTHDGGYFAALLGACRLSSTADTIQFALLLSAPVRPLQEGEGTSSSPLMGKRDFMRMLDTRLRDARQKGVDRELSLVLLEGLHQITGDLDPEHGQGLNQTVESYLRTISSDGDSAAELADDRYGLIVSNHVSEAEIRTHIHDLLEGRGVSRERLNVRAWSFDLGSAALSDADASRALIYVAHTFSRTTGETFDLHSLSDGAKAMLESTAEQIANLRRIIRGRDFNVAYQPIVDLKSHQVHHLEALVRFEAGTSPQALIELAEETGIIGDLDLVMVQAVLSTMDEYRLAEIQPSVAINLSAASLGSHLFLARLWRILEPFHDDFSRLLIELTETARVEDFEQLNRALQEFRHQGIRVCLDDFGTGTTSLKAVHGLDFDIIKIDGVFVQNARGNARDMAMLKSMVEIARSEGATVVGERVETRDQERLLTHLGVQFGQGYLYGRPTHDFAAFTRPAGRRPARRKGERTEWR